MDSEFDFEEEATEEALERTRFARLLTALSCPAATIHIDLNPEEAVEAAIADLAQFANEEASRIQYEDDLPEYEALLRAKCKELTESFRLDSGNQAVTVAAGAIRPLFPFRAKLTPERDELIWRLTAGARLHRAAKSFIANAYAKFPHVADSVSKAVKGSTFASNLQFLIEVCGLSVDALAVEANIDRATIYRWLRCKSRPTKALLHNFVKGCNFLLRSNEIPITLDDLYSLDFESRLTTKLRNLFAKATAQGLR